MSAKPHEQPAFEPGRAPLASRNELVKAPRQARAQSWPGIELPDLDLPAVVPGVQPRPRIASSEREVVVVHSLAALERLWPEWQALVDDALEPSPFYAPHLALPALRTLAPRDFCAVLVYAPGPGARGSRVLTGFFPLEKRPAVGRVVPVTGFWKHRYCALCTPLIRTDGAAHTLTAFLDHFARTAGQTGVLRLEDIPADGRFSELLLGVLHGRAEATLVGERHVRAVCRKGESAEAYLAAVLPGKRRKELRRQRARLAELGRLEQVELTDHHDLETWLSEYVALEAASWKGRDGVALASAPAELAWFREAMRAAHQRGQLWATALRLDGRAIAMKINFTQGDAAFAFKIAFDEQYARFSPGVQLELENLEGLHARPDLSWMDSLAAPNRFMINHLWSERRTLQTLFIAPGTAASLAIAALPLARWCSTQLQRRRPSAAAAPDGARSEVADD
jgi:CelD/BcsL family acetyltransferase involved in cellulose biosynthesis